MTFFEKSFIRGFWKSAFCTPKKSKTLLVVEQSEKKGVKKKVFFRLFLFANFFDGFYPTFFNKFSLTSLTTIFHFLQCKNTVFSIKKRDLRIPIRAFHFTLGKCGVFYSVKVIFGSQKRLKIWVFRVLSFFDGFWTKFGSNFTNLLRYLSWPNFEQITVFSKRGNYCKKKALFLKKTWYSYPSLFIVLLL